ncbi:hypothetical protein COO03_11960 [Bacillus sp. AFS098217]|uniref:AimR family lysis-lysogeny pheromone receptor n=1 Tax=unclassified Bacillus (in: firmicutes) TaxID=185979 RepID=UPI000BEC1EE9|nr:MULTISPECIES: AimR family lysis-lysogeny pheromone receptor [unclassified Bacillus (in: firmicutes)]PEB52490.1 hypothetical protein COO03_11960 [Bacillus sp. AFS098217]PEU16792.1 hypothetical protein CN524_03430 [Bacillus sp. AFS019443]
MQVLLNKLHDDLYAVGITNEDLAKLWGVSSGNVSRIFNGHIQISFCFLTKTLIHLYEDHVIRRDIVREYLKFAKPENVKEAMEYLSFRGEFGMLKELIVKEKKRIDQKRKEKEKNEQKYLETDDDEWIEIYDLIYRRNMEADKLSLDEFDDLLEEKRYEVSSKEMMIFIDILRCQTAYQLRNYKSLFKRMKKIEKRVSKIKNKFIRTSYTVRLKEGMNAVLLMDSQILKVRDNSFSLLEICNNEPNFVIQKANAHYNIAESYIFENYTQSKFHFEQALYTLGCSFNKEIQRRKRAVERTLNFLKIYHNKDLDTLYGDLDLPEEAFLAIRKRNIKLALEILAKIKEEKGFLNEFSTFYLGLAKNDVRIIEKSLEMFIANNSNFYAKLPKIHLGID